jgi:hypothetical protein
MPGARSEAKCAMIDNKSMADYRKEVENVRLLHRNPTGGFSLKSHANGFHN